MNTRDTNRIKKRCSVFTVCHNDYLPQSGFYAVLRDFILIFLNRLVAETPEDDPA